MTEFANSIRSFSRTFNLDYTLSSEIQLVAVVDTNPLWILLWNANLENLMKNIILLILVVLNTGCAISQHVMPVDSGTKIKKIFVLNNERAHMKELVNEIVSQLKGLGFESESYQGDRPENAMHYITYTANWQWDMAMYLTYFKATLYEDGRVLGEVEYDARSGGGNMNKFGKTAEKIRPLLEELLSKVER